MSVREYIGARYVPLFADPLTWDSTKTYEPLTVVMYQGNSYTSRQSVPAGIEITNESYWAQTGNYNAQIEAYRQEVVAYNGRISTLESDLPSTDFDSENTVKDYIDDVDDKLGTGFDSEHTVKDYIDAVDDKFISDKYRPQIINRAELINRIEFPYGENSIQSVCAFRQNNVDYIAYGFSNLIRIYSISAQTLISSLNNIAIEHCNQMCYKDEKIYITTLNAAKIVVVNTSNINSLTYDVVNLSGAGLNTVTAFDNYKDDKFMVSDNGNLYSYDYTNQTKEFICTVPELTVYPGVPQTVRYSSRLDNFYRVSGGVNYVTFFDTSGIIQSVTQLREHYNLASVSELEDYIFFGNDIYFVSLAQTGYIDSISLSNVYKTDFIKCNEAPDDFNNPTTGLMNIQIDRNADGLNNNIGAFPSYGASGLFTFKYPQDIINLIKENGYQARATVNLVNACDYVIPIAGIMRLVFNNYDCAGVWISSGQVILNNYNVTNPDKTKWVQTDNNKPCFVKGNGGTIIAPIGPTTTWTDEYLIGAAYCEVYCVANAFNSSHLAACWGNKAMAYL